LAARYRIADSAGTTPRRVLVHVSVYLKRKSRTVRLPLNGHLTGRKILNRIGPGYGEFRTGYEPILVPIARSYSRHGPNGAGACAAIGDHGNPDAWHGASAVAPATTVGRTNDAEVLDGVLSVLTHTSLCLRS
jgi:hypothetical protein